MQSINDPYPVNGLAVVEISGVEDVTKRAMRRCHWHRIPDLILTETIDSGLDHGGIPDTRIADFLDCGLFF